MAEPTRSAPDRDPVGDLASEFTRIARRYWLLPHERLIARRYFDRCYAPDRRDSALTRNNGPVGIVMLGATAYAWGLPGGLIGLVGLGLLVATGGAAFAYWLGCIGIAMCAIAVLRGLPALPEARRYQAGQAATAGRSGDPGVPPPPPPTGWGGEHDYDDPGGPRP